MGEMGLPEALLILAACLIGGYILQAVGLAIAIVAARRHAAPVLRGGLSHIKGPLRILVPFIAMAAGLPEVHLVGHLRDWFDHGVGIVVILAVAWLAIRLVSVVEDAILGKYTLATTGTVVGTVAGQTTGVVAGQSQLDQEQLDKAQRIHTQVRLLRRIIAIVVLIIAAGAILMSFGKVRAYGASLLASAGIVGIVVGLAAQPIMTNLLAGAQIGIAQPFRVDDVVVIDGHWGRIEEISLTYVVVRIWDLRRLVLPISWFVQNPFENWTRSGADLLGYVHIEVDYTTPIDRMREELHRILQASPRWSGSVWNLQVTGAGPSTLQVRALMSARNSQDSWDLQCEVREKLVAFLRDNYPNALPRIRLEGDRLESCNSANMEADSNTEAKYSNAPGEDNTGRNEDSPTTVMRKDTFD